MKTIELLNGTLKELEEEEKMLTEGGKIKIPINIAMAYGAIAGALSTCSFPVGFLQSSPYKGGGHICTNP